MRLILIAISVFAVQAFADTSSSQFVDNLCYQSNDQPDGYRNCMKQNKASVSQKNLASTAIAVCQGKDGYPDYTPSSHGHQWLYPSQCYEKARQLIERFVPKKSAKLAQTIDTNCKSLKKTTIAETESAPNSETDQAEKYAKCLKDAFFDASIGDFKPQNGAPKTSAAIAPE